jgi:O-antigen/teichoic acid export membrane protein
MVVETEVNFPVNVVIDLPTTSSASIVNRITRGLGALSLGALVQIVGQITMVPVALYAWGKIRYGEWIVLSGLVTVLRLTDLGLQTFVVNRFCASFARGDRAGMQRDLHSALRVQIPMVVGVMTICAIVLFSFPIDRFLAFQTVTSRTFSLVAMMLVTELMIGVPMGVIAGLYRATARLARAAVIGAVQQFSVLALTIMLVLFGEGFVALAAVRVGIAAIVSIWILWDLRRLYPWLRLWPSRGHWRDGAGMIGPGLFFLFIPLADYLSTQLTLLLVQSSLDGGEVSRLATHRTVVNLAMLMSGLLTTTLWPELTALHARSDTDRLIKAHRSLARVNLWLVAAISIGMLPFIPLIYPSWTAGKLAIDSWTLAFLLMRMLLWGVWSASMTLLCAVNRQKPVALALLGAAAITSVLSIFFIPVIGMSGAALAQLLGDLSVSAWLVPWLAARETKDSFSGYWLETMTALLKGVLIPVALGLVGWRLIHSQTIRLFVLMPTIFLIALALMWTQMASYERSHFSRLFRSRFAD